MRFELRLTNRWFVYRATLLEVVLGHTWVVFFCLVVVTKSLLLLCQSHERRRRRIAAVVVVVVVVVLERLLFVDRSNPFRLFLRLPFRAL